jgi:hypothetical protein
MDATFSSGTYPFHKELRKKYFSKDIKEKFLYWLKFISLNTRSSNFPPQVVIVFDKKVYE